MSSLVSQLIALFSVCQIKISVIRANQQWEGRNATCAIKCFNKCDEHRRPSVTLKNKSGIAPDLNVSTLIQVCENDQ